MILNFSNPEKNIKHLNLKEGDVVADFGCGSGHYVIPLSNEVGENGKVYGIDVQKSLLMKLGKDITQKSLHNIETIWGDLDTVGGSKLRTSSLDALVVSNLLFQVENKPALIKECYRVLKTGAKLLLVDWSESFGGLGPQPKDVVGESSAREMLEQASFVLKESIPAGNHHYGMVFIKA